MSRAVSCSELGRREGKGWGGETCGYTHDVKVIRKVTNTYTTCTCAQNCTPFKVAFVMNTVHVQGVLQFWQLMYFVLLNVWLKLDVCVKWCVVCVCVVCVCVVCVCVVCVCGVCVWCVCVWCVCVWCVCDLTWKHSTYMYMYHLSPV